MGKGKLSAIDVVPEIPDSQKHKYRNQHIPKQHAEIGGVKSDPFEKQKSEDTKNTPD
jgi:hypothetical protein